MSNADFLVIGGGIAGLSAAARLARHGRVVVIEAEEALGYHSSGRSATIAHNGIPNRTFRGLAAYSRLFLESPPEGFSEEALGKQTPALFAATEEMLAGLETLHAEMRRFTTNNERVGEKEIAELLPVLRTGEGALVAGVLDHGGFRIDSDALLQGYARMVRAAGGETLTGERVADVRRVGADWEVASESGGRWTAPVIVNAAGAWADEVARLAGVSILGFQPKRRTIIVVDPPAGEDVRGWAFMKTIADEFYMLPEGGRLMASATEEVDCEPCDAVPEEYDIAFAAYRLEQYTTLTVRRIAHRWAGLRTFAADRVPVIGFAPDASGFFWLAGQGGYGLQCAPAMAEAAEALVTGEAWPEGLSRLGVEPEQLGAERLIQA